jgi:hypothetical protein
VEQKVNDPTQKGRRVFELVLARPFELDLARTTDSKVRKAWSDVNLYAVISPTKSGPHRLIVRQRDRITHVLPLVDRNWREFKSSFASVDKTRVKERDAILFLWKQCQYGLTFQIKDDAVSEIRLSSPSADDSSVRALSSFDKLIHLGFRRCETLRGTDYAAVNELESLTSMSFYDTEVTDSTLEQIGALSNLESLSIRDDSAYEPGRPQTALITDEGLANVSKLRRLKYLHLSGDKVTDQSLAVLSKLPALSNLTLNNTAISPARLLEWARESQVERIQLRYYHVPNKNEFDLQISEGCSRIEFFGKYKRAFFHELTKMKTLEHLILPASVTDHDLEFVGKIGNLKTLAIRHNGRITDEGIAFLDDLSNLEELDLWYSRNVSDQAIRTLKKLGSLKKLNLAFTSMSEAAVAELKTSLTDCEIRLR